MSANINGEEFTTFNDLMNDDSLMTEAERATINFEVALIGKLIEAREKKGLSQKELAELAGVKQPAIARLENMKATPQIDTLFKVLESLDYTLAIVLNPQPRQLKPLSVWTAVSRIGKHRFFVPCFHRWE